MASRHFSSQAKRLAWKRCKGLCEKCTTKLTTGNIRYDHVIPWEISYDSSLENCQVICKTCDAPKTYQQDIPTIAKVHRIEDRAIGIERSGKPLLGGRDSPIRKKINGEVVARKSMSERHRELMSKRQIGGNSNEV
jgi:5-methylcytosine-specific restriction enzyme A